MTDQILKILSEPVYISGAISANPALARNVFARAEWILHQYGFRTVYNPLTLVSIGIPADAPYELQFATACEYLHKSKILVQLPSWEFSPGARMERCMAYQRGMLFLKYKFRENGKDVLQYNSFELSLWMQKEEIPANNKRLNGGHNERQTKPGACANAGL